MGTADFVADPFDLARFVDAQAGSFAAALAEIARGEKRSHWMWFVFPQYAGLGRSAMAERYAIGSRAEARAYLAHPLLGARLRQCVATLDAAAGRDASAIFGEIDALKLRSSLTLFDAVSDEPTFRAALARWFDGVPDARTLALLQAD